MQETQKAAPAKKRRQRRKEARPSEIIEAAMTLWAERGFAATKLDDVAKAAGVAKGTIYLYFSSKEVLFQSAVEDRLVSAIHRVGALRDGFEGSTEDLLRKTFETIQSQLMHGGGHVFLKVLIAEGHRFPDLVKRYREVGMDQGMIMIRSILARGAERGELRPTAAKTDPRLIMAPLIMSALWENVFNPDGKPMNDDLVEELVSLLLDGLRRPT